MRTAAALLLTECDVFQNLLNTSSKIGKSSTLLVRMLRKLRNTSSRSVVSTICSAVVAVTASAGVTESPCALNSRQKTRTLSTSSSATDYSWQLCFKRRHVAFVLEETSERLGDDLFVQLRGF